MTELAQRLEGLCRSLDLAAQKMTSMNRLIFEASVRLALSCVLMLLFRRCRVCARVRWHPAPGTTAPGSTAHWHNGDLSSGGQSFRLVLRRTSLKSPRGNMYPANFQPEEPSQGNMFPREGSSGC